MNFRRVRAMARKEFLHVLRDPRSLLMAIGIPVLMLVFFGYALTLDVDNVPLIVWDSSGTPASRDLVSRFPAPAISRCGATPATLGRWSARSTGGTFWPA